MNTLAKKITKNLLCEDPEINARIEQGIEANRKGFGSLALFDPEGKPVTKADISFRLVRHEYRFGCNAFMLGQFKEAEKNARYEELFAEVFNLAVLPFYWGDLEPEDGKPRFAEDSAPIYRRPPPDAALAFCERNRITPKGHVLCWHMLQPSWLPAGREEQEIRLERRIREIAERYAGRINIWDVCNEALQWNPSWGATMPANHVEKSFRMAGKYFPESTELLYNDGPWVSWDSYRGDYTPLYMLSRHLLESGLPIRGLGLQYHMAFREPAKMPEWANQFINQRLLLANLDQYAKLGIPINVSEITVTGHPDLGDGDRFQERVMEKLYRLWFSHAATNGIAWWNLVDDTAYCAPGQENSLLNENKFKGGLLNYDLSPKPAFIALKRLLRDEWTSSGKVAYADGQRNPFHGFYGDYELDITTDAGTVRKTIRLSKDSKNEFQIRL